jgi:PAS domain S-box-containing protein
MALFPKQSGEAAYSADQWSRLVFASAGHYAIMCMDMAGIITAWNPAAERILGWPAHEALGRCVEMFFTPEDRAHGRLAVEMQCAADRGTAIDERWHLRRDGTRFWAMGQLTALREDGTLVVFAKILCDRTPERLTVERLRIAQLAGGVGTFEVFPETGTVVASAQFRRLWGLPAQGEVSLSDLDERVHPEDRRLLAPTGLWHGNALQSDVELRVILPGGDQIRWLVRHGSTDPGGDRARPRYVGVVHDITDHKHTEHALLESQARERETATRFRELAEFAPAIVWQGNTDGSLSYLNSHWFEYTGQTPAQALPMGWVAALHPDDAPGLLAVWENARDHGVLYEAEARLRHHDGRYHWYIMRARPLRDEAGVITGWLGCDVDIDDLKAAEAALQESESRWRGLFEQMQEGFYVADAIRDAGGRMVDFRYVDVNPAFESLLGVPARSAMGNRARQVNPQLPDALVEGYARVLATEVPDRFEMRLLRQGAPRWFETRARRIDGDRFAVVFADITARKRAELLLRKREQRQTFLLTLGDRLRSVVDAVEALDTASRMLGQHLDVAIVAYPSIDLVARVGSFEHCWSATGVTPLHGEVPLDALSIGPREAFRRGETLVATAVPVPGEGAQTHEAAEISRGAYIVIPLYRSENVKTVLYVADTRPREWLPDEIQLAEDVAERTWNTIAKARTAIELERRVAIATAERDQIWRNSPDVIGVIRPDNRFQNVNPAIVHVLGWQVEEFIARPLADHLHPDDLAATLDRHKRLIAGQERTLQFENRYRHKDGSSRWLSWTAAGADGLVYATGRDVTDFKDKSRALEQAEDALRQAQKMEAVGQLTGGVAHDFNNLLQGITGSLELLQRYVRLGCTDDTARYVQMAMASANRAAALTRRLLAFSRQQPIDSRPVDANRLLASMDELLRRTIGESIRMEVVFAAGLWMTRCDANQLENALLNLAIDARDAMPDGGRLTFETANMHLDHEYAKRHPDVAPGQYVAISVTDTGTGMPAEVIARAFEPFFTTKPVGQGTGLGLSMTYGFARQSGGSVGIYSELGQGTTIRLYLPRHEGADGEAQKEAETVDTAHTLRGGTVLLVEDDVVVRALVREILEDQGYRVLEADDGVKGLNIATSAETIDLLVTDVGLPGLNGRQLADAARQCQPGLKTLFMTGYAENAAEGNGFLAPGTEMISKPFSLDGIAARIRKLMEQ